MLPRIFPYTEFPHSLDFPTFRVPRTPHFARALRALASLVLCGVCRFASAALLHRLEADNAIMPGECSPCWQHLRQK